jgi:hypothetical protein
VRPRRKFDVDEKGRRKSVDREGGGDVVAMMKWKRRKE